ncbi:MAG: LysR substrate-binding domain-containing protein [Burkholderiaceae bacterium]
MLKIRQLEAFHAVMVAGTVTAAAARLRLSQPAISALIAGLEQRLGFSLFVREKSRLQPTDEARYFHGAVVAALEGLAGVEQLATDIRTTNAGTLRVAALPMLALEFLPRVAAHMLKQHPGLNVTLQARSSPTVVNLVTTQQFDIGFSETAYDPGWVDAQKLRLRCVCAMPADHELARKLFVTPADLSGLPSIAAPRDHFRTQRLQELFAEHEATLSIRIETPLFASMCAFVIEGAGYAIVDPVTAHNFSGQGLVARRFEPAFFADFAMLFPASKPRSLVTQAFADLVVAFLKDYE